MNVSTNLKPAVTLIDKLNQAGHYWSVENRIIEGIRDSRSDVNIIAANAFNGAFRWIENRCAVWGIQTSAQEIDHVIARVRFLQSNKVGY